MSTYRMTYTEGEKLHPESMLIFLRDAEPVEGGKNKVRKIRTGEFLCECGKTCVRKIAQVKNGSTRSCGCYREKAIKRANTKHGLWNHPLYNTWFLMRDRCENKNSKAYSSYGGRGVTVCDRWTDPVEGIKNFIQDMGERPSKDHSLDRVDNMLGYSPENCVWATKSEQAFNRRLRRNNATGRSGVSLMPNGRYRVVIGKDYKRIEVGHYDTLEEAIAARDASELEIWGWSKSDMEGEL